MAFLRAVIRHSNSRNTGNIYLLHGTKGARNQIYYPLINYCPSALRSSVTNPLNNDVTASINENAPVRDPLDTNFSDPKAAFKSKTTWEVVRAYLVYQMCSSSWLVENNMKVNPFYLFSPPP